MQQEGETTEWNMLRLATRTSWRTQSMQASTEKSNCHFHKQKLARDEPEELLRGNSRSGQCAMSQLATFISQIPLYFFIREGSEGYQGALRA